MNSHNEKGITVQDALFNGVITLVILATLIAVFFVVRNQFAQSNAQSELAAIISGTRQANQGSTDYTSFSLKQLQTDGLLPSDASMPGDGGIVLPWVSGEIYDVWGSDGAIDLEFTTTTTGICIAVLNAEAPDVTAVANANAPLLTVGSLATGSYVYEGKWQTNGSSTWTPQTACANASNGLDFWFK